MHRIWLILTCLALAAGCTTSRKVVVNHGYPGTVPPPAGFETKASTGNSAAETPLRF